jgi:hypothetical protein
MSLLVLKAYRQLVRFDLHLARGDFSVLYDRVRRQPVRRDEVEQPHSIDQICQAVDMACIWYWKRVFCLQRSAATACLLKRHGVAAQMVIGAQQMPFKAHAWVEVSGRVVNDKPYTTEMYAVLDRC